MILEFRYVTGDKVALAKEHIVSVRPNSMAPGSIIKVTNGDQHAVSDDYANVISGWNVQR